MKEVVVRLRASESESISWNALAKSAGLPLSEWIRRRLNSRSVISKAVALGGAVYNAEIESEEKTAASPPEFPEERPLIEPLHAPVLDKCEFAPKKPKWKRPSKCVTEKCERLGPSCEPCRQANAVSF